MKVSTIEKKARRILMDTYEPYRWESGEIRDAVQEGVYALNAIRPETRYVDGRLVDVVEIDEESDDFQIDSRFEEALVYFVVHKCYLDDNTDTVNAQLAEQYLGKFNTKAQL